MIAFDDVRVFRDPGNPRYRAGELTGPDSELYVDMSLDELIAPFSASHVAVLVHNQEGAMVLLPVAVPPPPGMPSLPALGSPSHFGNEQK